MGSAGQRTGRRRLRIETVRGEPCEVNGHRLIPIARIVSWGRAGATIGTGQFGGWGVGLVSITPLAVVEETAEGEHTIPITDGTMAAVRRILLAAVATTLFFAAIRRLVHRSPGRPGGKHGQESMPNNG